QEIFVNISSELDMTFTIFIYGVAITYLIFYNSLKNLPLVKFKKFLTPNSIYLIAIVFFILSFSKFLYYFISAGGFSSFRAMFIDEKLSLNVGISFPICACALFIAKEEKRKSCIYLFSFLALFLSLISTSKIFIVISLIYISGIYRKEFKFKIRVILFYLILGFLLFSLSHLVLDKLAGGGSILYSLYFTFLGYLLGGFAVFQHVLDGLILERYSSFVELIARDKENVFNQLDSGWIKTGDWLGNVYSGFTPWYNTYGNFGILLLAIFIGIIYSVIYSFANKKSLPFLYLKAFSIYPITFFVFSDTFFSAKLMWIAFVLCSFIIAFTKFNGLKE
ncbi:O-antigen polymerase, partial [Providencia rettgeri]|uniref:O-antigen polymerase n=1 Tax=Providencia rettgeri TaxID=587 RepID=UPI001EE6EAAC